MNSENRKKNFIELRKKKVHDVAKVKIPRLNPVTFLERKCVVFDFLFL